MGVAIPTYQGWEKSAHVRTQAKQSARCRRRLRSLLQVFCHLPEGRGLLQRCSLRGTASTLGRVRLILPRRGGRDKQLTHGGRKGWLHRAGDAQRTTTPRVQRAHPRSVQISLGGLEVRDREGRKRCTLGLVVPGTQVHGSEVGPSARPRPRPACCPRVPPPGPCPLTSLRSPALSVPVPIGFEARRGVPNPEVAPGEAVS